MNAGAQRVLQLADELQRAGRVLEVDHLARVAELQPVQAGVTQADTGAWVAEQRALDEYYFAFTQVCFTAAKPPGS